MIKYIGLCLLSLSVILFWLEYGKSKRHRSNTYDEISSLLRILKEQLPQGGSFREDIIHKFNGCILKECGLIDAVGSRGDISAAIQTLDIDEADKERFCEFLTDFGRSDLLCERQRSESVLGYFEKRQSDVRGECERAIKLAGILLASLLGGAMLLVI